MMIVHALLDVLGLAAAYWAYSVGVDEVLTAWPRLLRSHTSTSRGDSLTFFVR